MHKQFRLAFSLSACATAFLATVPADAIVAIPPPRTCSAFSAADVVVVGNVVSQRVTPKWDIWSVSVEHRLKGSVPDRFEFYSENDSGRATPDVGARNILFLYRMRGRLMASGSDPNTGGRDFDRVLREARVLTTAKARPTGSVVGLVAAESGAPRANARVRFSHSGSGAVRFVRTDSHGRFELSLPPGRWSAKLAERGWASRLSLYTYDNPDSFSVKPGGCNDLRLEPVRVG